MLEGAVPHDRSYLGNTNVLQTRIKTSSGIVQVTDFMVAREELRHPEDDHILVRRLQTDAPVRLTVRVDPAFNYARDRHEVRLDGCCVHLVASQRVIHLDGPGEWSAKPSVSSSRSI